MSVFTKLVRTGVAAAVIGAASLGVQPAKAMSGECHETDSGATICILQVRRHVSYPNVKFVKSSVNGDVSWDQVYCDPAYRYNYKDNLWGKACYEYN